MNLTEREIVKHDAVTALRGVAQNGVVADIDLDRKPDDNARLILLDRIAADYDAVNRRGRGLLRRPNPDAGRLPRRSEALRRSLAGINRVVGDQKIIAFFLAGYRDADRDRFDRATHDPQRRAILDGDSDSRRRVHTRNDAILNDAVINVGERDD